MGVITQTEDISMPEPSFDDREIMSRQGLKGETVLH